ncbi:MAG: chaperone modulator CbpM [Gammaproteobacteria bacterium]|jgi:chaperone modulatory protein CbpM
MMAERDETLSGEVLGEADVLTLAQVCRLCSVSADRVLELVAEGVIEPRGENAGQWRFQVASVRRVRRMLRLQRDLGLNIAGAALAVELLEELEVLRARVPPGKDPAR